MKPASPALASLLAGRQFFTADLYRFSLAGGGQLYYCSGDRDVTWNGAAWSAGGGTGPYFDRKDARAKCHWKIGVEVDTLVFNIAPGAAMIEGEPFLYALRQGVFDGAELTLYRAFMPTYGDVAAGAVTLFAGRVAEIDASGSLITVSVNSHLELLNQNLPRNLYQSGCVNTLFDASCGLSGDAFAVTGSALGGSTISLVKASLTQGMGYFDLGVITFTGGANVGISRTVKTYASGAPATLSLILPLPSAPAAGDGFTLLPGCDKQQATCANIFNNLLHFRGFPYIPQNETAA